MWDKKSPYPETYENVDDWFDSLIFHENRHAIDHFSRIEYAVNKNVKNREEAEADAAQTKCTDLTR